MPPSSLSRIQAVLALFGLGIPGVLASYLRSLEALNVGPSKIIGGTAPNKGDYPFYVHAIGGNELCGGSLIHGDIVMTAAHCVKSFDTQVIVGGTNVFGTNDGSEKIDIDQVLVHPDYDGNVINDIMLVSLKSSSSFKPLLWNKNQNLPVAGTNVTAMGFGLTQENGAVSNTLLEVTLDVVDYSTCKAQLSNYFSSLNDNVHLCAGVAEGGKDSCNGDSGGPLIDTETGLQYGLVSFGHGCGRANTPGAYTRISTYADWIDDFICQHSASRPDSCPSFPPSEAPSSVPTISPAPSAAPSGIPSSVPSAAPSDIASSVPTISPAPSVAPSDIASSAPTISPAPSAAPSDIASSNPTISPAPSVAPTAFVPRTVPDGECPDDPNKTVPGICGCGVPDVDSDGDGAMDCEDFCPSNPARRAPAFPSGCK